MKCPRCQHENPASQKFCGECGARLTAFCPSCGATNPPGQKFCGECGASLTEAPAKKFAAPESYTPKHLAEKILLSKTALEGERIVDAIAWCPEGPAGEPVQPGAAFRHSCRAVGEGGALSPAGRAKGGRTVGAPGRADLVRASEMLHRDRLAEQIEKLVHHAVREELLHLLGDMTTHPDRFDAKSGENHYRQALTPAEPRGMRPLVAHCHLGLGKLYRRTDKREQAQEHLTRATAMYREMGMTYWLERAEMGELE